MAHPTNGRRFTSDGLATRLDEILRARDLSVLEAAVKAEVGITTAYSAAKGHASRRTVERLAKALGVSPDDLASR